VNKHLAMFRPLYGSLHQAIQSEDYQRVVKTSLKSVSVHY